MDGRLSRKEPKPSPPPVPAKTETAKCAVCGQVASGQPGDELCWICRRLKISAWRDSDHSMPSQE
jgi:hypothetical protein